MDWLRPFRSRKLVPLTPIQAERLAAWQALPKADPDRPFDEARYVVVDVESSGLDLEKDRLIAIGAIAVAGGRIVLDDALDIVLQQEEVSAKDNILIHGISGEVQRQGVPPADALLDFLEYLGQDPLIAFHVTFDNTMIRKAVRSHLGFRFDHAWADLAYVAPALYPEQVYRCRSLDQWSAFFGIGNFARHSALADAMATADLLLRLRPRMAARRIASFRQLRETGIAQQRAVSFLGGM